MNQKETLERIGDLSNYIHLSIDALEQGDGDMDELPLLLSYSVELTEVIKNLIETLSKKEMG